MQHRNQRNKLQQTHGSTVTPSDAFLPLDACQEVLTFFNFNFTATEFQKFVEFSSLHYPSLTLRIA